MSSRLKIGSAVVAALLGTVIGFEGIKTVAYRDVAGVPTVCAGETKGVKMGDRYTMAECKAMLVRSLDGYAAGIERCVKAPLPDERYVALVSFAYNVGVGAACKSTAVRLINEGRTREGCDQLLRWNKAGGVVWPGLTRRRAEERALCLAGVAP